MADVIEYKGKRLEYLCRTIDGDEATVVFREIPDEPDEVEALALKVNHIWGGAGVATDDWLKVARYVLANYVPMDKGIWYSGYESGKKDTLNQVKHDYVPKAEADAEIKEAYSYYSRCAAKPRISPADLDALAQGERLRQFFPTGKVEPYPRLTWEKTAEATKKDYRNTVLAMLNAEVADDVDFVVSGACLKDLTPVSEQGKGWYEILAGWPRYSRSKKCNAIANAFDLGYTIRLDTEGGGI